MTNKIFESIRKIATQLGLSTPQSNDGIYIDHLLNQVNSRVGKLNEDFGQSVLVNTEYERRIIELNQKLDVALAPYLERNKALRDKHRTYQSSNTN
ncbi:hypothetical protein OTK49_02495 [Vibrio coralliirubri]|uniref:hypothetical protein n=1 Tax=Vibrio coralliirubri TaxID=1516159 RepID=UPI002283C8F2|nr:hypothetical protein [Vibrio coralliirubri]MCY9861386.1 hypothetical protein [Vibrio coralliirubri]